MGISGLLPFLKEAQQDISISKYRGKVLGIDAYVWLHRGAYGCAEKLALEQHTDGYVQFAMRRVRMLRDNGIIPYVVFDGDYLPAKAGTEKERAKRREYHLRQGKLFLQQGDKSAARDCFVKCIDVTHEMAYEFIKELRRAKVEYIVAPYEADAQLAYLERNGDIDGIITEDSDLLVFGCKTVLYKVNESGDCVEMLYERRKACKRPQLATLTDDDFRQMAILSGCDYLESIQGMGLKTAYKYMRSCHSVATTLRSAKLDGMKIPDGYQKAFERAEKTFLYQRVFRRCKETGNVSMVTLHPCDNVVNIEAEECIGPLLPADQIDVIARGDMHPITKKMMPQGPQYSIVRSASAPSRMSSTTGRKSKVRTEPVAGQAKMTNFLIPKLADVKKSPVPLGRTTTPAPIRNVLSPIDNTAQLTSTGSSFMERSKYFPSTEVVKGDPSLARFPPTQEPRNYTRCNSTDSGEISSPMSSARKPRRSLKHGSSPLADDAYHSSPTTSPLLPRTKTFRDKDAMLLQQHKSPILADSDVEEDDVTISTSLFQQFAYEPMTPMNGRSIGGWTRHRIDDNETRIITASRSINRSISGGKRSLTTARLSFDDALEDKDVATHTPALKRRLTESMQSESTPFVLSVPHLRRMNT